MKKIIILLCLLTSFVYTQAQTIAYNRNSFSNSHIEYLENVKPFKDYNTVLSLSLQPSDLGYGLRIDQRFKTAGFYTSITINGVYHYPINSGRYINNHNKVSAGLTFYPKFFFEDTFFSTGISWHWYDGYTSEFSYEAIQPISFEVGVGTMLDRFCFSVVYDVMKIEAALNFGIAF